MTWSSGWQRKGATPAWALAVAVLLAACTGDATNPESEASAGRFGNLPSYISVTPKDNVVPVAGGKVQLSVEVRDSRGKTIKNPRVNWRSLEPVIADVSAGGTVTTYSKGTARIVVESSPVSDTAWVVVQSGPIATALVKVSPTSAIIPDVGGTTQLSVEILDAAGNPIQNAVPLWSSADATIASVSSSGKVVGLKQGDVEIRASHGGKTGTSMVSVAPPPPPASIAVTPASDSITAIGGTKQFVAKLEDASGAAVAVQVAWSSVDVSIAEVDGTGKATGKAKGSTRIVASYQSLADTADVHVVPAPTATRIAITPKTDTIPTIGGSVTLTATVYDETDAPLAGASVVWASLDPAAAIVGPGMVAGVSKGVARITAKSGSLADTAHVWVAPAPAGSPTVQFYFEQEVMVVDKLSTIWKFNLVLDSAGTTRSVKPTVLTKSTDTLTVYTEAYVYAKAMKNGQARLVATYNGMTDSALVKVGNVTASSVSIAADSDTIAALGDTAKVNAVVLDVDGNLVIGPAVTWSSLDPSIATVSGTGDMATVTGVAGGSARIVAQHGTYKDTITVLVSAPPPPAPGAVVEVNPATDTIPSVGGTKQLTVSVVDAQGNPSANQTVTWSSLNAGVASVSASGLVTGTGPGVAQIRATQGSSSDTATIWVSPSSGGGPPQNGYTVDLKLVRWTSGSGTVRVSSGIPLPAGALQSSQLRNLVVYVGGIEQQLYVEALQGRHGDGSLRSVLVQFNYSVPSSGTSAQLVLGPNVNRTTTDIAKTNPGVTYGSPLQAAVALPSSPAYLMSTGIVGETRAAPSTFSTRWESQFTQYEQPKWDLLLSQYGTSALDGNRVTTVNYYDRALIYYAWWVRTGNPEWWKRAAYAYLPWRDTYMKPNGYRVQPNNIHIEGMEAHYLLTGDQESLTGVKLAAEYLYDVWLAKMGDLTNPWLEGRIQARTLDGLLTAARLQVTSRNFQNATQQALTAILSTQQADGSYRFISICNTHYNYMTGLLHEVYIKYYQDFSADARIPAALKKALDFMWNTQWLPSSGAFKYASDYCPGLAGPSPAADLNLLIANGYGWYARHSGDGTYRSKGDLIFHEGVMRAWLVGEKQFNENYRSAFHYEAYRQ